MAPSKSIPVWATAVITMSLLSTVEPLTVLKEGWSLIRGPFIYILEGSNLMGWWKGGLFGNVRVVSHYGFQYISNDYVTDIIFLG
jgi:hypothetical protein